MTDASNELCFTYDCSLEALEVGWGGWSLKKCTRVKSYQRGYQSKKGMSLLKNALMLTIEVLCVSRQATSSVDSAFASPDFGLRAA